MDNHNTEKSYQVYIRRTPDTEELIGLGAEMSQEDPEAKRNSGRKDRERFDLQTN